MISYQKDDQNIITLTIDGNDENHFNAVCEDFFDDLDQHLNAINDDRSARGVILTSKRRLLSYWIRFRRNFQNQ